MVLFLIALVIIQLFIIIVLCSTVYYSKNLINWLSTHKINDLQDEINKLKFTDEEINALETVIDDCELSDDEEKVNITAPILRSLFDKQEITYEDRLRVMRKSYTENKQDDNI